ncbi:hypothetical protein [Thioalkalivibrio sp.]|nr:hypothetical protein [Thioalkalivibrio sp.]
MNHADFPLHDRGSAPNTAFGELAILKGAPHAGILRLSASG